MVFNCQAAHANFERHLQSHNLRISTNKKSEHNKMVVWIREDHTHSSLPLPELEDVLKAQGLPIKERPPRRHVIFAPQEEIFEIPHHSELSQEEIDSVWMSKEEFEAIRRECKKIIMMIQHDSRLVRGIELRGLEHHTLSRQKRTEELQELLYDTVDRLMAFHEETSMDVSEMLAEMCQKISSGSEEMARQKALEDEKRALSMTSGVRLPTACE